MLGCMVDPMYVFLCNGDVNAYITFLFAILLNARCVLVLLILMMSGKKVVNGKQKGERCDCVMGVLMVNLSMMVLYIMCVAASVKSECM